MSYFSPYDDCNYKVYITLQILDKYKGSLFFSLAQSSTDVLFNNRILNDSIILGDVDKETLILVTKCLIDNFDIDIINEYFMNLRHDNDTGRNGQRLFSYYLASNIPVLDNKYIRLMRKTMCVFKKYFFMDKIYFGYDYPDSLKSVNEHLNIGNDVYVIENNNYIVYKPAARERAKSATVCNTQPIRFYKSLDSLVGDVF